MKCQNCGKEINQDMQFCDNCGAPVMQQPQPPMQNNQPVQFQQNPVPPQMPVTKKKKPLYKKWWFWVLVGLAIIIIYAIGVAGGSSETEGSNSSASTTTTVAIETTVEVATDEPTTEKPTDDPAKIEQKFKDSCESIDFKTLSRNPDKYKGNNYKLTGEVIQVQEGWLDTVELRINITKEEFEYIDEVMWTDTIYATVTIPEGADNILVDDVITFWGTCDGEYTYTSVLGDSITLPKIDIKYYELAE